MVYNFFNKNSLRGGDKSKIMLDQQLAEDLHKQINRKFEKQSALIFYRQYLRC